jgi:hypothetical protein
MPVPEKEIYASENGDRWSWLGTQTLATSLFGTGPTWLQEVRSVIRILASSSSGVAWGPRSKSSCA